VSCEHFCPTVASATQNAAETNAGSGDDAGSGGGAFRALA
jgi:hypothetical protein